MLEYKEEPADKTGVLTREEAAELSKTDAWQNNDPNLGQG